MPIHEAAFYGDTSIRSLSRSLHEALHKNWPCQFDDHDHTGTLGNCLEAKLLLDPQWSSKPPMGDGFFVMLTGPYLTQESRICLASTR
jgi:hypothetical protein